MNEETKPTPDSEMLDEYDFSQAVRGNPYPHLSQSTVRIASSEGDRQVQIKTIEVVARVAANGQVTLQLPPDISPGEHHITLLIQENLTHPG